jgi:hypothetical protein
LDRVFCQSYNRGHAEHTLEHLYEIPNPRKYFEITSSSKTERPSHLIQPRKCSKRYHPIPSQPEIINHCPSSIPLSTPIPCQSSHICASFPQPVFMLGSSYITVQGIGMQQHSYPSHSMHFVFPAAPLSLLTIELMVEEAAEPGPLRFTRVLDEVHILI